MSPQKFRRKQYFVAARFQLKYVGLILLLMFLTATMCSYVVYYTAMLSMGEKLANVYPQGRLINVVNAVNFRILVSLLLVTPFVVIFGIFLSHRIAGPIFRMESFMKNIAAGDLTSHLILRKGDELINLANGINALIDGLKTGVSKEKERVEKASADMTKLKMALNSIPINQAIVNELVDSVSIEIQNLSKEMERYKL